MKEFGIKEENVPNNLPNTIEFTGSGREILELMKNALCEFNQIYVVNAFLHPHHGFAGEGRATLNILVNIPNEKKWISINYSHHESPISINGSGKISYEEHYYHREPFPQDWANKTKGDNFTWGYGTYNGDYILDEILEIKKCKIKLDISANNLKFLTEEDILNLEETFKNFVERIEESMGQAEKQIEHEEGILGTYNYKVFGTLKVSVPRIKDKSITIDTEMNTGMEFF